MSTNHQTLPVMCRRKEIDISGEKITVKEITWHDMLALLKKLTEHGNRLVKDGKIAIQMEQLAELITSTDDLATMLVFLSTGKEVEWLNGLAFGDALEVIDAALEINLSGEVMGRAKKVGGRLKETLGIKAAMTIAPTPPLRES